MGSSDRQSGRRLVEECVSGSEQAWGLFYAQHHALIEGVVKRHAPYCSVESRKDIVQAVYVRLVESLATYDDRISSLRTFVSMVAARTCIDWLRGQSRMSRKARVESIDHDDDADPPGIVVKSELDLADEQLAKAEAATLVRAGLDRLSETCRELLRLRFFLDLTYERIAALLGKKENTVNVQILRCIAKLRDACDKVETEGLRP